MKKIIQLGKGGIKFVKRVLEYEIRSPIHNFRKTKQIIEYRMDPITRHISRINQERSKRPEQAKQVSNDDFLQVVEKSRENCPFCIPQVYNNVPMFISEHIDVGRLERDTALLFPNAYPFAMHHAVVIITQKHYLTLNEISDGELLTAFYAIREFFHEISLKDPLAKYMSINMNFLPPSGASIIHPHMQVFLDYKPTRFMRKLYRASKKYKEKYGNNAWDDLVDSEREIAERYVIEGRFLNWITAFAPKANKEIIGIAKSNMSNFMKLSDEELEDLSKDISDMFSMYYKIGVRSINMTIMTAPINRELDYFKLHVRIIARKNPSAFYSNDRAFMEVFHEETISTTLPEKLASELKSYLLYENI